MCATTRRRSPSCFPRCAIFAEELRVRGFSVRYVTLDDAQNSQSLFGEVERAIAATGAEGLVVKEPGDYTMMFAEDAWRTLQDAHFEGD